MAEKSGTVASGARNRFLWRISWGLSFRSYEILRPHRVTGDVWEVSRMLPWPLHFHCCHHICTFWSVLSLLLDILQHGDRLPLPDLRSSRWCAPNPLRPPPLPTGPGEGGHRQAGAQDSPGQHVGGVVLVVGQPGAAAEDGVEEK